jgi:integrase
MTALAHEPYDVFAGMTPIDAGRAVDRSATEAGAEARARLRASFGDDVPNAITEILDPSPEVRVKLRDVEVAAVLLRTGFAHDAGLVFLGAARAPATYDAYDDVLTDLARWCAKNGEAFLAITPLALARYVTDAAGRRVYATLKRLLVAINALHAPLGIDIAATTTSWIVRQSLKGIANEHGRAPRRRARAFVVEYLTAAIPWYRLLESRDPVRATRNVAILALGLATDLRAHSLVGLTTDDVDVHDQGLRIRVRHAKNRKAGDPMHVIAVHAVPGSPICPVAALKRYAEAARLGRGPLFRGVGPDGKMRSTAMNTATISAIVRQAVRATGLGLDDRGFSSHSLRSGGITSAWQRGAEAEQIMAVSDHASADQMLAYVRPEDPFANNHTARLFGGA